MWIVSSAKNKHLIEAALNLLDVEQFSAVSSNFMRQPFAKSCSNSFCRKTSFQNISLSPFGFRTHNACPLAQPNLSLLVHCTSSFVQPFVRLQAGFILDTHCHKDCCGNYYSVYGHCERLFASCFALQHVTNDFFY